MPYRLNFFSHDNSLFVLYALVAGLAIVGIGAGAAYGESINDTGSPPSNSTNPPLVNGTGSIPALAGASADARISATSSVDFVTTWRTTTANETITIPVGGYAGTYVVHWGDGTNSTQSGDATHTYTTAGSYNVSISGDFKQIILSGSPNAPKLTNIVSWGHTTWQSLAEAFKGASNMVNDAPDAPKLSQVTDMRSMFEGASSFDGNLSHWDVSKVTNMGSMFKGASSFDGDISAWKVSEVTNMGSMFQDATSFNGDLSGWDTSGVTVMNSMFYNGTSFDGDISAWKVSGVTNMGSMFRDATSFNGNISQWDVSGVTNMGSMFRDATSFNGNISQWDVSGVTDMGSMFQDATSFNQNLGPWYIVLNNTAIMNGTNTIGGITAQNGILDGQIQRYALVNGTGDVDNGSFEITNGMLSIKSGQNNKDEYFIRIGATGSNLFGQDNSIPVTINDQSYIWFTSAIYYTGNGTIEIEFSETVKSMSGAKLTISDGASMVSLSDSATVSNNVVTATLNATDRAMFGTASTMSLYVETGAVTDNSDNPIAASNQTVTVLDTILPKFVSAEYAVASGLISIQFSETIKSVNGAKLAISDGANATVSLSGNAAITSNNVVTETLNDTNRAKFNDVGTMYLNISEGAVTDNSDNPIAAVSDQNVTVKFPPKPKPQSPPPAFLPPAFDPPPSVLQMDSDAWPPGVLSASYDTDLSALNVTFDETINVLDRSKFRLNGGSGLLILGAIQTDGALLHIPVVGNAAYDMTLDILAGAVQDTSGNRIMPHLGIAVEFAGSDTMPRITSASYDAASGSLTVSFDDAVTISNATLFSLNGSVLRAAEHVATIPYGNLHFILDKDHRDMIEPGSVLDAGPGAAQSLSGTPSRAASAIPIRQMESFVSAEAISLTYNAVTDTVWIEVPGGQTSMNGSLITIRNSTASFLLSEMDVVLNGMVSYTGGAALSGNSSIFMDVGSNAIISESGAIPAAQNISVAIFDGIGTDVTGTAPAYGVTKLWPAGQGMVLAAGISRISIFDINGSEPTEISRVWVNDTDILDVERIPDATHMAVLAGDSVRLLDVADPASPEWGGRIDAPQTSAYGAISYVVVNDIPHVVSITPDHIFLVRISDAERPHLVSAASLSDSPEPGFDAVSLGSVVYAPLQPNVMCRINMENIYDYAVSCVDRTGDAGPMETITVWNATFVAYGGNGTISIRTADLKEYRTLYTGLTPTGIGVATIYNNTYVLATAGTLRVFDIGGEPFPAATVGPYSSVTVVNGTDDIPYAILLGPGGLSVIDLAGLEYDLE